MKGALSCSGNVHLMSVNQKHSVEYWLTVLSVGGDLAPFL